MIRKKTLVIFLSAISFSSISLFGGEPLLEERFANYSDDSELSAVWAKVGNAITYLASDPTDPDTTVLFSKGDRRIREFSAVTPTNEKPLYLQVDYFDDYQPDVPGREYIGLWASATDSSSLIEVGLHNNTAANATDRYTARVFGSRHGAEWFDLRASRKREWQTLELWIFADTIEIYIDGALDTIVDWPGGKLGAVRIGFGAGSGEEASATGVYYDNLRIDRMEAPGGQGTLIELSASFLQPSFFRDELIEIEPKIFPGCRVSP